MMKSVCALSVCSSAVSLRVRVCVCVSYPLPKAVLALCKAVQMSVCPQKGEGVSSCLAHCQHAGAHLQVSVSQSHNNTWLHKVRLARLPHNNNAPRRGAFWDRRVNR